MPRGNVRFGYFREAELAFFRHTDRKICVYLASVGEWVSRTDAVVARDLIVDGAFFDCERPHPRTSDH